MKTYEALQRCIDGKTVLHARELHLSTSSLSKWQEPTLDFSDSGAFNPLDRIEKIVETSLKLGTAQEDALAPIQYLAQAFNSILIPLPKETPTLKNIHFQLYETVKKFGGLMEKSAQAMADGRITPAERQDLEVAGHHLLHHVGTLLQLFQEESSR